VTAARQTTLTSRRRSRRQILGVDRDVVWLMLPALIPILVLSVYPLVQGIYLGFTDARAGANQVFSFTGFENYMQVFSDGYFWQSFVIGLVWAVSVTAIEFALSLGLALLLNLRLPGRTIFRIIAILPWAVPPVVIGFMWQLVYHPNAGLLNHVLRELGIADVKTDWLASPFALPAVVVAAVWAALPITTVVLLAALQSVPRELNEAAALDRAGAIATFRIVTWPVILPSVVAITALGFITQFNSFSLVYVMTNGAPGGSLRLPMLFAYEEAFTWGNFGYAAAIGNVMVIVIAAFLVIYLRLSLRGRAGAA
jgi:multiple sugar transport system permease protein